MIFECKLFIIETDISCMKNFFKYLNIISFLALYLFIHINLKDFEQLLVLEMYKALQQAHFFYKCVIVIFAYSCEINAN